MKQYTTPTVTIKLEGQELLLDAATRIVAAAKNDETLIVIDDDRCTVEGGNTVKFTLTEQETAAVDGILYVELTIYVDDKIYKTNTMQTRVDKAIWNNGGE